MKGIGQKKRRVETTKGPGILCGPCIHDKRTACRARVARQVRSVTPGRGRDGRGFRSKTYCVCTAYTAPDEQADQIEMGNGAVNAKRCGAVLALSRTKILDPVDRRDQPCWSGREGPWRASDYRCEPDWPLGQRQVLTMFVAQVVLNYRHGPCFAPRVLLRLPVPCHVCFGGAMKSMPTRRPPTGESMNTESRGKRNTPHLGISVTHFKAPDVSSACLLRLR